MPNIVIVQNDYPDLASLSRVVNYAESSGIIGGYGLDPYHAFSQMKMVKACFHKPDGILLIHFFITFTTAEAFRISVDEILDIGFQTGQLFGEFQMVYGVHFDSNYMHLHVVMNTVSFVDGHKYSRGRAGFLNLKRMLQDRFPKSDVGIYKSISKSDCNRYTFSYEDDLLRID